MSSPSTVSANYEMLPKDKKRPKRNRCLSLISSPYLTLVLSVFLIASITYFIFAVVHSNKQKQHTTKAPIQNNFTQGLQTSTPTIRKVRNHLSTTIPSQNVVVLTAQKQQTSLNCSYDSKSFNIINSSYTWENKNEIDKCEDKSHFLHSLKLFSLRNGSLYLNSQLFCSPQTENKQCDVSTDLLIVDNEKGNKNRNNKTFALVKCEFTKLHSNTRELEPKINISFTQNDYNFHMNTSDEFLKVKCLFKEIERNQTPSESEEITYERVFAQVIRNENVINEIKDHNYPTNNTNLIFITFGSLSKSSFHANLRQTKAFFELKNAHILHGFTSLGEDNLIPLLTDNYMVEKLPLFWKAAKETGHVTLMIDDKLYQGRRSEITDHYMPPVWLSMESTRNISSSHSTCANAIHKYTYALDYIKSFHEQYQHTPKLSVVAVPDFKKPEFDRDFYDFLKFIENTTDFSNTAIIITGSQEEMSDPRKKIDEKTILENSPISLLFLPTYLEDTHPTFVKNMQENSNKLTTPLDLDTTMMHLFNSYSHTKLNKGVSLFERIPDDRNCASAGVPLNQCFCARFSEPSSQEQALIEKASNFVVAEINQRLVKHFVDEECKEISLESILAASWSVLKEELGEEKKEQKEARNLLLRLKTLPAGSVFKAAVEVSDGEVFKLVGDVAMADDEGYGKAERMKYKICRSG